LEILQQTMSEMCYNKRGQLAFCQLPPALGGPSAALLRAALIASQRIPAQAGITPQSGAQA